MYLEKKYFLFRVTDKIFVTLETLDKGLDNGKELDDSNESFPSDYDQNGNRNKILADSLPRNAGEYRISNGGSNLYTSLNQNDMLNLNDNRTQISSHHKNREANEREASEKKGQHPKMDMSTNCKFDDENLQGKTYSEKTCEKDIVINVEASRKEKSKKDIQQSTANDR